jgi:hypothetical protein
MIGLSQGPHVSTVRYGDWPELEDVNHSSHVGDVRALGEVTVELAMGTKCLKNNNKI